MLISNQPAGSAACLERTDAVRALPAVAGAEQPFVSFLQGLASPGAPAVSEEPPLAPEQPEAGGERPRSPLSLTQMLLQVVAPVQPPPPALETPTPAGNPGAVGEGTSLPEASASTRNLLGGFAAGEGGSTPGALAAGAGGTTPGALAFEPGALGSTFAAWGNLAAAVEATGADPAGTAPIQGSAGELAPVLPASGFALAGDSGSGEAAFGSPGGDGAGQELPAPATELAIVEEAPAPHLGDAEVNSPATDEAPAPAPAPDGEAAQPEPLAGPASPAVDPTAAATVTTTLDRPVPLHRLAETARTWARQLQGVRARPRTLEVQLDPPRLGRVRIEVSAAADGAVRAVVQVENPQAQGLLEQQVSQLHQRLAEAGVHLQEFQLGGFGSNADPSGREPAHQASVGPQGADEAPPPDELPARTLSGLLNLRI